MGRRKPFSAKAKKVQLQTTRALKRGDSPPPSTALPPKSKTPKAHTARHAPPSHPTLALQSRFASLTADYLAHTRDLAHSQRLVRPIPRAYAEFEVARLERDGGKLRCPARPRFRVGQTKKEVERNEEGLFTKWKEEVEGVARGWVEEGEAEAERDAEGEAGGEEEGLKEVKGPSWWEGNLEVWRQLWRVTETSSILLILLDSRCPAIHLPHSLRTYVQSLRPNKEVILLLTKTDLVDPRAVERWKDWIKRWWAEGTSEDEQGGDVEVVGVRSYDTEALNQKRGKHVPAIPRDDLGELVKAIQRAHQRLLQPPPRIRDDPDKLGKWKAPVRREIAWADVLEDVVPRAAASSRRSQPNAAQEDRVDEEDDDSTDAEVEDQAAGDAQPPARDPETEPLTIGLIGQPNVGKSSLLNAILGETRVRASKTPGKTKHFQTLFWGWRKEIKLVDCPGLVCPSLVGIELQALCGILPISQIPSLPACIHYAATLLPLEEIFRVPPPEVDERERELERKKTWRGAREPGKEEDTAADRPRWTAGEIMEGRALERGYLTAKGGRPDANRAANGMLRALAEGKVKWGFWPPGQAPEDQEGRGILLGDGALEVQDGEGSVVEDDGPDPDAGASESGTDVSDAEEDEDEEDEEDETEEEAGEEVRNTRGFFAALEVGGESENEDEEEDDAGETSPEQGAS